MHTLLPSRQFWVGVVSREHVQRGVEGGFIQLNHGKKAPLQRMRAGDGLLMYSPRTSYPSGAALQHFTAIGVVVTGEPYQVEMSEDFKPYRVDVRFFKSIEVPIRPLIERLSFIKNKTSWGATFRFGYIKVPAADFALVAKEMGVDESVPMSTWRRKAIEVLPAKREIIEEAESPMALWIDLWLEFETAARQNDDATVRCILEYAFWCISPAAGKLPSDASTAAVCAFFEHLPTDEALWPRLPEWLSPRQFEAVKPFFHYFLSDAEVDRLAAVFYSNKRHS